MWQSVGVVTVDESAILSERNHVLRVGSKRLLNERSVDVPFLAPEGEYLQLVVLEVVEDVAHLFAQWGRRAAHDLLLCVRETLKIQAASIRGLLYCLVSVRLGCHG